MRGTGPGRCLAAGCAAILTIAVLTFALCAQPATWDRTYGGIGLEEAYSVQQTADSGFVFHGQT
jgi:hypothetical protein